MTLLLVALSVLVLWLTGFLLVSLLWLVRDSWSAQLSLKLFLGLAFGFGVSSCHLFLWLVLARRAGALFIAAEIVLALLLLGALSHRRGRPRSLGAGETLTGAPTEFRFGRLLAAAFYATAGCAFAIFAVLISREPHGQFDAVAMWNTKARMIFRGGASWADVYSGLLQHPDYPLLLPLSVARCWTYAGRDTTLAPCWIAALFTFGIAGLLVSSLSALRSRAQGYLAGIVLFAPFTFITCGVSQYADTPFAFFLLASLALFCLHDRATAGGQSLLLLAGASAGFAAWTKNEGMLFLVALAAARCAVVLPSKGTKVLLRQLLHFASGLLPVLLLVLYFKSRVATANDIAGAQNFPAVVGKLEDSTRYRLILSAFADQLINFGGRQPNPLYVLALYPFLLGVKVRAGDRPGALTAGVALALLALGYFFVYLVTPQDLKWHLSSSLDRLLIQLWPSFVFTYFSLVRAPGEAAAP